LPNLEILSGGTAQLVATALPLVRQHAFEAHLSRTMKSIDAEGLIDARTGLLTSAAFERDFASAVYQTQERGGGLSVARFAFDPAHPRAQFDGARIISRLMRQMDFGAVLENGSVNNQIDALILSVGGFLGMGEHYVAVSPSSVSIRHDAKNDKWLASMNTTKEALKAAPEFKYPK
jgi:hypothetical protein